MRYKRPFRYSADWLEAAKAAEEVWAAEDLREFAKDMEAWIGDLQREIERRKRQFPVGKGRTRFPPAKPPRTPTVIPYVEGFSGYDPPYPVVYFVEALNTGLLKIGYSTGLGYRLSGLATTSPIPLRLHGWKRAYSPRRAEREFHARFDVYRAHGEWFRFEGDLRTFVEGLAAERLRRKLAA